MTYERPAIVDRTDLSEPVISVVVNSDTDATNPFWAPHDTPSDAPRPD